MRQLGRLVAGVGESPLCKLSHRKSGSSRGWGGPREGEAKGGAAALGPPGACSAETVRSGCSDGEWRAMD